MGLGPSLQTAINNMNNEEAAKAAVEAAIANANQTLANTEQKARDYINRVSKGITSTEGINNKSYSKYSDDYSLAVLDGVVDRIIKTAQDKLMPGTEPTKASEMAGDIGTLIKATLVLAAMSTEPDTTLQVFYNHITTGEQNYAVYYATNSMSVSAENLVGSKDITVISNMYLFTKVNANVEVTIEKILQEDLDTLVTLNEQYDKAIIAAMNEKQLKGLQFFQEKLRILERKIKADLIAAQNHSG